jgi:hypothetical protein
LIAAARWDPALYDPIQQEVTRNLFDAAGRGISLILRHSEETREALTTLQNLDGATAHAVLGSLHIGARGLFVDPITIWTDQKPIHLTLDGAAQGAPANPRPADAEGDELEEAEDDADSVAVVDEVSSIGRLLAHVEAELLAIAESGVHVVRDLSELRSAAANLRSVDMTNCATAIEKLCDHADRFRRSIERDDTQLADALLACAYLTRLAAECQTVCEVVGT